MAFLMYSTACMAIAAGTDMNSSHATQRNVMTALKDTAVFFKEKKFAGLLITAFWQRNQTAVLG